MPLVPESRPRHHPLSSRPVTCKFPLRTQSTLSAGRGLQGRPTRHLCPCAGLRSPQAGHELSVPNGTAQPEVPAGRRGRLGPISPPIEVGGRLQVERGREHRGQEHSHAGGPGLGALRLTGSRASRDLRVSFGATPAAAGRHRARRAAGQVCGGLAEPLRLPPGEGRCCGGSRAARPRGGARLEGRAAQPAALPAPPPSCPGRAPGLAPPRRAPAVGAAQEAGTPHATSVCHEWRLPRAARKVASTAWKRESWGTCLKG